MESRVDNGGTTFKEIHHDHPQRDPVPGDLAAACASLTRWPRHRPPHAVPKRSTSWRSWIGCWSGRVEWRSFPGGDVLAERTLTKDVVATAAFCPDAGALPIDPPPLPPPPESPFSPAPFVVPDLPATGPR